MANDWYIDENGKFYNLPEMNTITIREPPLHIKAGDYHPACCYVKSGAKQLGKRLSIISRDLKEIDEYQGDLGPTKPIQYGVRLGCPF